MHSQSFTHQSIKKVQDILHGFPDYKAFAKICIAKCSCTSAFTVYASSDQQIQHHKQENDYFPVSVCSLVPGPLYYPRYPLTLHGSGGKLVIYIFIILIEGENTVTIICIIDHGIVLSSDCLNKLLITIT